MDEIDDETLTALDGITIAQWDALPLDLGGTTPCLYYYTLLEPE